MPLLVIPLAALSVWPIYLVFSRSASERRPLRMVLLVIFLFQLFATVVVAAQRFRHDIGRFDDAMFGLVAVACLSLLCSLGALVAGEWGLFLKRRRQRAPSD